MKWIGNPGKGGCACPVGPLSTRGKAPPKAHTNIFKHFYTQYMCREGVMVMTRDVLNSMRNTIRYNAIVGDMRKVGDKMAEFKQAKERLESKGALGGSRGKVRSLENVLGKVAPELELWQRDRGMMGIISDAELVRRLEGPDALAVNAGRAEALLDEVDMSLRNESLESYGNHLAGKETGMWRNVLKVAKSVAAVAAAAGACAAAYAQIRYGASMGWLYQIALSAAGGALVAAGILSRGEKSAKVPDAVGMEPEVAKMRLALSGMREHLNRLKGYSPQAAS